MAHLHFSLFGPPEVRHGEHLVSFSTGKSLALLLYLTVEGGTHTRRRLSEFFWPESDSKHGRISLRAALLRLREGLAHDHEEDNCPHLLAEQTTLRLDFASDVSVDLHVLQDAWQQVRTFSHLPYHRISEEERVVLCAQLEQATRLFRGEFLAGFSLRDAPKFDDWTRSQVQYWHTRLHQVFEMLFRLQEEAGEIERATQTVIHWLNLDPLHEEGYGHLMRLYMAQGNRTAALRTYDACRTVLAREGWTELSQETLALVERIRVLPTSSPEAKRSLTLSSQPPTTLEGSLVGRGGEFRTLIERFALVRQGQMQVVLIEGEAGIGKTRLAHAFLRWAQASGADIMQGKAYETGGRFPYQPLLDALRTRLEQENAPDDLLSDVWLTELSRLLPELSERYPDLPVPLYDTKSTPLRLFEAITRLGQSLAAQKPLVLFLDDVQWADLNTLDALRYLSQQWMRRSTPIFLLINCCTELVDGISPFSLYKSQLTQRLPMTHIALHALSVKDILHLLSALETGSQSVQESGEEHALLHLHPALQELAQRLFTETEGHPLYLIETLQEWLQQGMLHWYQRASGTWAIDFSHVAQPRFSSAHIQPSRVYAAVEMQLKRLTPSAHALLIASVIVGKSTTFEELCRIAGLSEQEGLSALDEVLRQRLLREEGSEPIGLPSYTLRYNKLRSVIYSQTSTARLRIFEQRRATRYA